MALGVSSYAQALSRRFQEAAKAGNSTEAFNTLSEMSLVDSLSSCLELAETDSQAFKGLAFQAIQKVMPPFCVRLVNDGFIPQDVYVGISADIDYHFARIFILRIRAEKSHLAQTLWGKPDVMAQSKPFYPEMVRNNADRRSRICAIAEKHVDLRPEDAREVALFSLGGLYDFNAAKAGARPQKGTTCILFARSVLHASGCNMIGPKTSRDICMVPGGLAELPIKSSAYIPASDYDKGKRPQPGDIFHIAGANFKDNEGKDTGVNSTHVGIVINAAGDTWATIEGGASDHVTHRAQRKLVEVKSSYGKWAFAGDNTSAGVRPLQGWIDISQIDQAQWMVGV